MRFPSLQQLIQTFVSVIRRYPMELLAAITGTYAAAQMSFNNTETTEHLLQRLLLTAALALPAFLAITLNGQFRRHPLAYRILAYLIACVLLIIFFFNLHQPIVQKDLIRFFLLNIATHLLVACIAFIGKGSVQSFWQFNRHLFIGIITAVIFSMVLFAGLAGALAAADALFDIEFNERWYFRLFTWIAGLFNTIFFLAQIPRNMNELEEDQSYPKVLKVFTQFVLIPLVIIYLIILLTYEGKIIIQWRLPKGWVSNLVIAYGIFGILSILLVHPVRSMEGNRWIKMFARLFYLLLIPLVGLMLVAIITRVNAYGFTEPRIFVLVLSIWLGGLSIYHLLRPNGDIRVIPISLALLALIISSGPLSAFELSRKSQRAKLLHLLKKNKLLINHKAGKVKDEQQLSFADRKGISTTIYYLLEYHGEESILPWFDTTGLAKKADWEQAQSLVQDMNLSYVWAHQEETTDKQYVWYHFQAIIHGVSIKDYDIYAPLKFNLDNPNETKGIHIRYEKDGSFAVWNDSIKITGKVMPEALLQELSKKHRYGTGNVVVLAPEEMQQLIRGTNCTILIQYEDISYEKREGKVEGINYSGALFIDWD